MRDSRVAKKRSMGLMLKDSKFPEAQEHRNQCEKTVITGKIWTVGTVETGWTFPLEILQLRKLSLIKRWQRWWKWNLHTVQVETIYFVLPFRSLQIKQVLTPTVAGGRCADSTAGQFGFHVRLLNVHPLASDPSLNVMKGNNWVNVQKSFAAKCPLSWSNSKKLEAISMPL